MGEILTRAEIEAKYDGEWVLVGDPEADEHMQVLRGTVLVHSKDGEEFSRQRLALRPRPTRTATLWFGKMPEHILLLAFRELSFRPWARHNHRRDSFVGTQRE